MGDVEMYGKFLFETPTERAERSQRARYMAKKRYNQLTQRHPEAVALFLAGAGVISFIIFIIFCISQIQYTYRVKHWIETTCVVESYVFDLLRDDDTVKCRYELDGETYYAELTFSSSSHIHIGDTVPIYLKPTNKRIYIGKTDQSSFFASEFVCLAITAVCLYFANRAYKNHYLFNGDVLFSQRMNELGIDTSQFDEFHSR